MPVPQVLTIAAMTWREALRNRLLWLALAVLAGGFGLAEFVGAVAITESVPVRSALLAAGLRLFAVFLVALFIIATLVREFDDKRVESLLSLSLPRAAYYAGKLLGFAAVAAGLSLLIGLVLMVHAPAVQVGIWTLSLACELLIVAAVSLLAMFTFHQLTSALSAVLAFYLLSRSIHAFQLIGQGPLADPQSLAQQWMAATLDLIAYLLPDLYRFTSTDWLVYHTGTVADLGPVLGQTLVYVVLLAGAGLFDLYRRNL